MVATEVIEEPLRTPTKPLDLWIVRPTLGQGGADRVTLTLLQAFDRELFRPSLVLMRATGELLGEVPADVPIHDLGARSLWTAWWPLARRLRRRPPQILFSTSSGTNLTVVIARLLCGRRMRTVLSERNAIRRRHPRRFKRWLQARLKRLLYPRADCVTAVSRGVAAELVGELRLAQEQVRVVYNPVVTSALSERAAAELDHLWFSGDEPILLGVGRFVPAKRFDLLIEILTRLESPRSPRLVLLGDGPELPALTRLVSRLGLENRVWLAGFRTNPFAFMARCTVFVLSSSNEGLPGALIQAMACGAAVVATDCPHGPSEIVEDGVSGLLVPVDDGAALVAGIDRLLDDPGLRARLGRAGRRAAQRFSLEAALGRYVDALLGEPVTERELP